VLLLHRMLIFVKMECKPLARLIHLQVVVLI